MKTNLGRICALVVVAIFMIMTTTPVNAGTDGDWDRAGNALSGGEVLGSTNSYDLNIITNNAQRMTVKAGGFVGINTAGPLSVLEVRGTGTNSFTSTFEATDNLGASSLFVRDDGNVGIGTSSPQTTLHVKELTSMQETIITLETQRASMTSGQQLATIRFTGPVVGTTPSVGAMIQAEASGPFNGVDADVAPTKLKFFTQGGDTWSNLGTARMVITYDGRVGIGTEDPDTGILLHVDGGMERITSSMTATSEFNYVPGAGIQVLDDSDFGGMMLLDRGTDRKDTCIYWGDNPSGPGPDNLIFSFANYAYPGGHGLEERMRIVATGNVGIGETNPTQRLHVGGSVRIEGGIYDSSNDGGSSGQVLTSTGPGGIDWADAAVLDQNLWETINSDAGSTIADSPTDTLNIYGAGIASTSISGDTLTITATEVDGSITNEMQDLFQTINAPGGTDPVADSTTDTLNLAQGGIVTITGSSSTDTITISATEVDGSTTNELQTLAQVLTQGNNAGSNSINMNTQRIENLGDPDSGDDAMDRDYADGRYLLEDTSDVWNDDGSADTLRFEGDTDDDLLYIDGVNDRIGIGTTGPQGKLEVYEWGTGSSPQQMARFIYDSIYVGGGAYLTLGTNDWNNYNCDIGMVTTQSTAELYFSTFDYYGTKAEAMRIDGYGRVGIGTSGPTGKLDVNGNDIRIRSSQTPGSSSADGYAGEIAWDTSYIYVCTSGDGPGGSTDTWERVAISTW